MWSLDYILLKNFAGIYVGTGLKEIEIDMSKRKSKICLLIGKNGSGKTSLLSALQPKAYNGKLDVRNNIDNIIHKKDGYKELRYTNHSTDTVYIIKHFYKYNKKKGRTIKSFMTKIVNGDEIELNPNGNVTSFNEVLEMEFNVNDNYLELIRLGNNVVNLINKKPSERKKYISEILSNLDSYIQYHKVVTQKYRDVKSLLKNITMKLERLKYDNEEDISNKLKKIKKEKKGINKEIEQLKAMVSKYETEISLLNKNNIIDDYKNILSLYKEVKVQKNKKIALNERLLNQNIHMREYLDNYSDLNDILIKINTLYYTTVDKIEKNKIIIESNSDKLDKLYRDSEIKSNYLEINKLKDYKELIQIRNTYLNKINEYEKLYKFEIGQLKATKDEIYIGIQLMDVLKSNLDAISTYDSYVISSVYDEYKKDPKLTNMKKELNSINKKISNLELENDNYVNTLSKYYNNLKYKKILEQRPHGCTIDDCPFIKDALRFKNIDSKINDVENKIEHNDKKLVRLNFKAITLNEYFKFYNDLKTIFKFIEQNKDILNKLPNNDFYIKPKKLFKNIKNRVDYSHIYQLDVYITFIDEYNYYKDLKENKLVLIDKEISIIKDKKDIIDIYKNDLTDILEQIDAIQKKHDELTNENTILNKDMKKYMNLKEDFDIYAENIKDINIYDKEIQELKSKYELIENSITIIKEKRNNISDIESSISYNKRILKNIEKEYDELLYIKKSFNELNDEKSELESKYFELDLLKDALSSNKGIPLIFIQLYLKRTRTISNELLKECFDGQLFLDDFIIDDKKFDIPLIIDNYLNPDVGYASQGQQSLITLVLSFALIQQNINNYNVLLLDEIDGPLDSRHRRYFINLLENQMDDISSQQAFLISHNPEFNNYPVDLIIMDKNMDFNNSDNVIFSVDK